MYIYHTCTHRTTTVCTTYGDFPGLPQLLQQQPRHERLSEGQQQQSDAYVPRLRRGATTWGQGQPADGPHFGHGEPRAEAGEGGGEVL